MTDFHYYYFFSLIIIASLSWLLPKQYQLAAIASLSSVFLICLAPIAAIFLLLAAIVTYLISRQRNVGGAWVCAGIVYCAVQFLIFRYIAGHTEILGETVITISTLGIAYFTCKNIHYLIESYKGNIRHHLGYFILYQCFLPVLVVGPINRYPEFIREIQRRHFDKARLSRAIERIIYGLAQVIVVGNYLIAIKLAQFFNVWEIESHLAGIWLNSLSNWLYLYAVFSGWSSVAIGFSLLMGINISENFNYPIKARNLVDFWQRWHISLSSWCKDYVFTPTLAITRKPFLAIIAAMLVMGIWHESSLYYLLWGAYHAIGIAVCWQFINLSSPFFRGLKDNFLWDIAARGLTFGYIVSGNVVITTLYQYI
jgi:alginate O-acetyltransferase complex protein AlgI